MAQMGCEHCGLVLNRLDAHSVTQDGRLSYPCPGCRRPMRMIGLREAMDLTIEREEAMRWRERRGSPPARSGV